jgi:molybdate transport system ATP-binding protein
MKRLQARVNKQFRVPKSPAFELDVTLAVAEGFTILFGPSGAGKSTLLDCMAGLLRPDKGRIQINERVVFDSEAEIDSAPAQRSVGYVFQRPALFPNLNVEKNVSYGLMNVRSPERDQKVDEILNSFRISTLRRRLPKEISGGEQQRVALARSLVTEPHLLLLDEPLSTLDASIKRKILDDLLAWNEIRRIPILYVTHSHAESLALGRRMIRLVEGRVVAEGSPAEVLQGEEVLD